MTRGERLQILLAAAALLLLLALLFQGRAAGCII